MTTVAHPQQSHRVAGWRPGPDPVAFSPGPITSYLRRVREPVHVITDGPGSARGLGAGGEIADTHADYQLVGTLPPIYPEWLGDRSFGEAHGVRFPYVAGEMANGIATTRLVIALARAGMLGFFGAAGLGSSRGRAGRRRTVRHARRRRHWGVNLIHSPNEPALEERVADLLSGAACARSPRRRSWGSRPRSCAAPPRGLTVDAPAGSSGRAHLFAKVSRPEVAGMFMAPAPGGRCSRRSWRAGQLTAERGRAGGAGPRRRGRHRRGRLRRAHRQPAARCALPDHPRAARRARRGTVTRTDPGGRGRRAGHAAARWPAAFALGAAYVLTGSVNQACGRVRALRPRREDARPGRVADVIDGARGRHVRAWASRCRCCKRGTMFGARAAKLYEAYRSLPLAGGNPRRRRARLERRRCTPRSTRSGPTPSEFWQQRDPGEIARASATPSTRWRWSSAGTSGNQASWAIDGEPDRRADYQILVRARDGRVQRWTQGRFLAEPGEPHGRPDRPEPAGGRGRHHPRAAGADLRRAGSAGRVQLPPPPAGRPAG